MIERDEGWGPCMPENAYLQRAIAHVVKCFRSKVQSVLQWDPIKVSHAASISAEKQTQKISYF